MLPHFTRFLLIFISVVACIHAQQPGMTAADPNFSSFMQHRVASIEEAKMYNTENLEHPELGQLFSEAPCDNCFEVISKRTETTKYFIEAGTNGSLIYSQASTDPMHILDESGSYITVRSGLQPDLSTPGHYTALVQPIPVGIHAGKYCYLGKSDNRFYFNRDLELVYIPLEGAEQALGSANWSNHTAGNDGVYVIEAWPGIDMEISVGRGQIKTNYIVKHALPQYSHGKLVIRDRLKYDPAMHLYFGQSGPGHGSVEVRNIKGQMVFTIEPGTVYDQQSVDIYPLDYKLQGSELDLIVPGEWFDKPSSHYPVIIDPLVAGSNNININGSGYNAVCFAGGCVYPISVPVPAAVTVTDILWTFNYQTNSGCVRSNGSVDFNLGACRSPNLPNFFWFCNVPTGGLCTGTNISIYSHLQACVPPPQCPTYNMNLSMTFYRCAVPGAGCANTCIAAATPLTMTVQGRTLEMSNGVTNLPPVTICQGQSTTLSANGVYGVPAYNYTWNPGNLPGNPSVSPASTTTYTVTVTDACGNTSTAIKTVNVTQNNNPGFTINPNPVCPGVPVTVTGLGSGPATSYDWTLPSSSTPIVNNTQVINTTYLASGTYTVTLNYASGSCIFPSTQTITVSPQVAPTAGIVANPSGPICPGTSVTFTANITNGGSNPSYQWQVNGANVGSNQNTFTSSTLQNGAIVTVILTSNDPCANPVNVTSNQIIIQVAANILPTANIVANPAGPICAGTNVTFTANITGGGSNPTYQWQVNGVNAGANQSTFSSSGLQNGDIISLILTSNDPCANPATVNSNNIVMQVNPVVIPTVNIAAVPAGAICAGTNVTFTANITNGGATPNYQWQVNGVNAGANQSTFSSSGLQNGDVVTVILTSSNPCANPVSVTSNSIVMQVNPIVNPTAAIVVNPAGPVCPGTNLQFTSNITNGGANPNYQWQVNGANVGANQPNFSSTALQNGDVVQLILTSSNPCANPASVSSNQIVIDILPAPVPTVGIAVNPQPPICAGTNLTFTSNITNGGTTPSYQWQVNGINVGANQDTYSSSALQNGDVVTVILTSNAICANPVNVTSNSIAIQVNPLVNPTVNISANPPGQVCTGTNITYTANITGGGANPGYEWFVNGNPSGSNQNTFSSAALQEGDVVTVQLTSSDPCAVNPIANSNSLNVAYFPPVALAMGSNKTICEGDVTTLTATPSAGNPASYGVLWQPGNLVGNNISVHPNSTTTYTATVTDACGSTATGSVQVVVVQRPVAGFSFSPIDPDLTNQPTTFTDQSQNASSWHWSFGNGITYSSQHVTHEYTTSGMHHVMLIVTSPENCKDTARAQILIDEIFSLFIPSAFTPNLDPHNPEFRPYGLGIRHYKMEIFNRWGEQIFESGIISHGWNGKLKGDVEAPQGVYAYRIDVEFLNAKNKTFTGHLTLIR